jgi:hypothetical protein
MTQEGKLNMSIAFCSIATRSYVPQARVLGYSLRRFHPEARLLLLVPEADTSGIDCEPFEKLSISDLPNSESLRPLCFYYNAFELSNALRGPLHQYMLQSTIADRWFYLDADTLLFARLDPVLELLDSYSIILSRHVTKPFAEKFIYPSEAAIAKHGIYNSGVLGLRRDDVSKAFVEWFSSRLSVGAFDGYRGYFVDQIWLNLVPCFFHPTTVCDHPGMNLGHWNLHERRIVVGHDGGFRINGLPLLLAHFSGWSIDHLQEVSMHAPMYSNNAPEGWRQLAERYAQEFTSRGWRPNTSDEYGFSRFDTGQIITLEMRRHYFELRERGVSPGDNPFSLYECFRPSMGTNVLKLSRSVGRRLVNHSKRIAQRFMRR